MEKVHHQIRLRALLRVLEVGELDADLEKSVLVRIARSKNSPAKRSKKKGDKSAVAMLKNYTTIGLRISRYGAAEVVISLTEELKHTETIPMCSIHKDPSYVMLPFETKIHRLE